MLTLKKGKENRLSPSRWDQDCYRGIISSESHKTVAENTNANHKMRQCYDFYSNKIKGISSKLELEDKQKLHKRIENRLK